MTLLFGNLTQDFVNFGTVLNKAKNGVPGAEEQIPAAAAAFRHSAALNASYLAYIGKVVPYPTII
jgi:ATP-binding cassette subfamily B (MDR/TAP) protein 1